MEAKPKEMRLGLIQLAVGAVKKDNLKRIITMVTKAATQGAQMVILPECCNSPFGNEYFPKYAESIPGESTETFSTVARDNKIYLVAGSIPERDNGILYNTSTVFDPKGEMIAKFRKMHMFDVDIPGKITFMESKTLNPGDSLATFDTPFCKVGLGICFDIRFPEFAQLYAKKGCDLLVFPAAFNMTTGPAHWELLVRARAVDNQLYVTNVSPARDETATYTAWGHTLMANPWGEVVAEAGTEESVVMVDMDLDFVSRMRQQIPLKRRYDVYELQDKQAAADS